MFDTTCLLPLPSDLFALILHPTLPILTVGLSSGHVHTYRLPSESETSPLSSPPPAAHTNGHTPTSIISSRRRSSTASENGLGSIETLWKTRRHKGSCRSLAFSHDGAICYSAGTDGLVKAFETDTGKVVSKVALPLSDVYEGEVDAPSLVYALNPQALLIGQDDGRLGLWDLRLNNASSIGGLAQSWQPHEGEHVSALCPMPVTDQSTSGFPKQWVSVGGTTLAVTDSRKGVIAKSEDQEVELTSLCVLQGLKKGGTSVGEKVIVGQGNGISSLFEKGVWGDLDERITIDKDGMGVETMAEVPPGFVGGKLKMNEKMVATGLEDGRVRFVRVGRNGVLTELDLVHDEVESVLGLGFDVHGRMISGGGQTVKVWTEAAGEPGGARKRDVESSDSEEADDMGDDDSEEDQEKSKRKKRKRNKGKDKSGGQVLKFSGTF